MEFNFYPWKIDVDVEKTKAFYMSEDLSLDRAANAAFLSKLTDAQKDFFQAIGVDPAKIRVEQNVYDLSDEDVKEPKLCSLLAVFLICGKFLSMPADQIDLYKDQDIYGKNMVPEQLDLEIIETDEITASQEFGVGLRFKHPISHFEGEQFKTWDCGYVCGAVLLYG